MSEIEHYGTPRHSGRYPWGSGSTPYQSSRSFLSRLKELEDQGIPEKELAKLAGVSIRELRDYKSIAKSDLKQYQIRQAIKLKEKGLSNEAIAARLGVSGESQVRNLLKDYEQNKQDIITNTAEMLKEQLKTNQYLDVGAGTNYHLDVSEQKLNAALTKLQMEGYRVDKIKVLQLGTGNETTLKVLSPPGTEFGDIVRNKDKIGTPAVYTLDKGLSYKKITKPVPVDLDRVEVRYAEQGGSSADGVIYIRRGVPDISLGDSNYLQARIQVGEGHYLKGMAMYSDDMPKGIDIVFNTNKSDTGNKLDAMKSLKDSDDLPFGSVVKQQRTYLDKNGVEKQSSINVVNEQGDWKKWSKTLSSQMLSKQPESLAKKQLDLDKDNREAEFKEIQSLTNPTIRKELLYKFADKCDSAAVDLKAKALPGTANHVILPLTDIKPDEIFAPNYENGTKVALIRHPHGGRFEIPILTVNNKSKEGRSLIGTTAPDAVGIHHTKAQVLSGADFDGDTVLVIPNNKGLIKSKSPLEGLKYFDPKIYQVDHKTIDNVRKQHEMGNISNLITDMTIRGANDAEIARAVRHSMVVIDSEKHNLDYKASAVDNGISELKIKYQGKSSGGANTLISKASSEISVPERKPRPASEGGAIDTKTGEKKWVNTNATYIDSKGNITPRRTISTKMAEAKDALSLSSGTSMEKIYGAYANSMKSMANEARKEAVNTKGLSYSPSAAKTYAPEVKSLKAKLDVALANAPKERQAQLIAGSQIQAIRKADPEIDKAKVKKLKGQLLQEARNSIGAKKESVNITPKEWEAIQNGAVSNNFLERVIQNSSLEQIREYATPRSSKGLSANITGRVKAMAGMGYTQAEIAQALGISTSAVTDAL